MNQFNGRTIIGGDPNGSFAYLYYKIQGDGSCFINCYLESASKSYQNEQNTNIRTKISRKTRLDFVNFLLSKSDKSAEKISTRLNIINPTIMCKLIKFKDQEISTNTELEFIKSQYNQNETQSDDFIFGLILSYNFLSVETNEEFTYETIKSLYERDHRINVAHAENLSTGGNTPYNPETFGVGKIPINIGYYEIANNIGVGYDEFITSINTLLDSNAYLSHIESILFATYIGINAIIFHLGTYNKSHYKLIDYVENAPDLIMVNLANVHWNLVSFKRNGEEQLLLRNLSEKAKDSLFNNLVLLYNDRMLSI
jgi:hypothetical protein